jgi:hypothetical protein
LRIPVTAGADGVTVSFTVTPLGAEPVQVRVGEDGLIQTIDAETRVEASVPAGSHEQQVVLRFGSTNGRTSCRLSGFRFASGRLDWPLAIEIPRRDETLLPPPTLPPPTAAIERLLIEHDWRLRDGVGAERESRTYREALAEVLRTGSALVSALHTDGVLAADHDRRWQALLEVTAGHEAAEDDPSWRRLWLEAHWLCREIALANPLAQTGPIAFIKRVPSTFSHQLTQYYGRLARPGGGLFVLKEPGVSMRTRELTGGQLPQGSFQHLEVSYDADRLLFAYCEVPDTPTDTIHGVPGRFYHLHEIAPDGSGLRRLTSGPYNDFAPRELPSGRLVFSSTRRGGWHRCGYPGCETYVLAVAEGDGSNPQPISRHETNEWDPTVLHDGRVVFTRWDYVDRNAVHYQNLWSTRPNGTGVAVYFGNATLNPAGIWEARAVPGSHRVMATAGPHHGMTAGSIVLVDPRLGVDGLEPLSRLTPDVLFPESESVLAPGWLSPGSPHPLPEPPLEQRRHPGHCYRSPHPLSESFFLAAYSYAGLVGEPKFNRPNLFGLYLCDRFGNRELLYRDLSIASQWPAPIRPRPRPPAIPSVTASDRRQGTLLIQNVYEADPPLPADTRIHAMRILQVLPKSTPGANNPMVGLANASPGKQVLGTVPVESDGSACFHAPADTPLAFQLLDEKGRSVQMMRTDIWVRAGDTTSCVGCHEPRRSAPRQGAMPLAAKRLPSTIEPGPEGSRPLSYPILVQDVLDRNCVRCHSGDAPKGGFVLTGEPEGHYTKSYNALAPRTAFTAWGLPGDFRDTNSEPVTRPDHFGSRASSLIGMLVAGHQDVELTSEDLERLITWVDANALFYGTFDPAGQSIQQQGGQIAGAALE